MVRVRQPEGYRPQRQVDLSEAVGYHIGRGVRGLFTRIGRLFYTFPLVVVVLVGLVYAYSRLGRTVAVVIAVVLVGLMVLAHQFPESPIGSLRHITLWQVGRAREHRERRMAPVLGEALGHRDHHGNTLGVRRIYDHSGAVVGLDVQGYGVPGEELERRLPVWAAALGLPHGHHLILRPGEHHGHHRVDVVPDVPELPERWTAPSYGDFESGLVLGLMEDGQLWRWIPSQVPHILVSGATGSGKTVTTDRMARCWMAAGGELRLADPKGDAFGPLRDKSGVVYTHHKADIATLCERVQADMMRRYEVRQLSPEMPFRPLLLVLEEAYSLLTEMSGRSPAAKDDQDLTDRIKDAIEQIAILGRSASVHIVLAPQRGDAKLFGGGGMRDQLGMRVLQLRLSKDSTCEMALEMPKTAALAGREPPIRICDIPPLAGRVVVQDQEGMHIAQVSM